MESKNQMDNSQSFSDSGRGGFESYAESDAINQELSDSLITRRTIEIPNLNGLEISIFCNKFLIVNGNKYEIKQLSQNEISSK